MREQRASPTGRLELAAALIASALVGAPLVVALVVRMLLLSDAAFVLAFTIAFALALFAVVLVFHRLRAQAEDRQPLRVPYMILAVQIAIGAVAATVLLFTPR